MHDTELRQISRRQTQKRTLATAALLVPGAVVVAVAAINRAAAPALPTYAAGPNATGCRGTARDRERSAAAARKARLAIMVALRPTRGRQVQSAG